MTPQDILTKAAALLESSPTAWTQSVIARNAAGRVAAPNSPEACSWCALGAIAKVRGQPYATRTNCPATQLLETYLGEYAGNYNDRPQRTREEVIAALRGAAELQTVTTTPAKTPESAIQ
jgi:hypothetical protein